MSEPRRINLIGGDAYSSTGGIQAMNRVLVRELNTTRLLRCAYFLWDDEARSTEEGRALQRQGVVRAFGLDRRRFILALGRRALSSGRDLWLCTHVNYALLGWMASRGRSRSFGVMLHAAELDEDFSVLKRFALRRAGFVISVSEYTKKKAMRLGVEAARVHVLPNGVEDPCPSWAPNPTAAGRPTVLFVGRMDERYKGQKELLDATALLRKRLPGMRTLFVGGGQTLSEWKQEAERRDVSDIVEFAGRVSDERLREAYAQATVFAMPSENEGFGLVYAEAMAHGLPCIGSDRDAAREVIMHGQTGYCVPAGNATSVADAIYTIVRSAETRLALGAAGRRRFVENFTTLRYRERLLGLMRKWEVAAA